MDACRVGVVVKCALCALEMVNTANGSSCSQCGMMTFGCIEKRKVVTLYKPIKKFGEIYNSVGEWSSVKYPDTGVVGWMETDEEVSE